MKAFQSKANRPFSKVTKFEQIQGRKRYSSEQVWLFDKNRFIMVVYKKKISRALDREVWLTFKEIIMDNHYKLLTNQSEVSAFPVGWFTSSNCKISYKVQGRCADVIWIIQVSFWERLLQQMVLVPPSRWVPYLVPCSSKTQVCVCVCVCVCVNNNSWIAISIKHIV